MMILSPPESVDKEIQRYKKAAERKIGPFNSRHSQAHISICKAERQKTFIIEPTLLRMEKKLSTMPPVNLQITGFGFFRHGSNAMTIHAQIHQSAAVKNWFKMLLTAMRLKTSITPHITIARNIPAEDFNILWPHFVAAVYNETFTIRGLTILKRDTFAADKHFQQHKFIEFRNEFNPDMRYS